MRIVFDADGESIHLWLPAGHGELDGPDLAQTARALPDRAGPVGAVGAVGVAQMAAWAGMAAPAG